MFAPVTASQVTVTFAGDDPYDPAFFTPAAEVAADMPDMPITLYQKGTQIEPQGGQQLGEIIAPYYNKHWDYEHGFVYLPPDQPTGRAAAVPTGNNVSMWPMIITSLLPVPCFFASI